MRKAGKGSNPGSIPHQLHDPVLVNLSWGGCEILIKSPPYAPSAKQILSKGPSKFPLPSPPRGSWSADGRLQYLVHIIAARTTGDDIKRQLLTKHSACTLSQMPVS